MSPPWIPEDELIDELQRLADDIGHTPTRKEMDDDGEYHPSTYVQRFGSWTDAQRAAGLEPNARGSMKYAHKIRELRGEL